MKKVIRAITGISLAFVVGQSVFPTASHAAPFQVGEQSYDIVAVTATFDGLEPLLRKQVWWGDEKLAGDFASVVEGSLGTPNMAFQGPYFAYAESEFSFFTATFQDVGGSGSVIPVTDILTDFFASKDKPYLFPVATPIAAIPLPTSGVLLLMVLASVASLRRRRTPG